MPEFVEWKKIYRLHRNFEITEKIDGTNGVLLWSPDYNDEFMLAAAKNEDRDFEDLFLYAGSRNRWVTPASDNFGFARWAQENAEALKPLGQGYHFGEWMGLGIQRGYGLPEKRFLLFDVNRWEKLQEAAEGTIPVGHVPLLDIVNGEKLNETVEHWLDYLHEFGSSYNEFSNPEGIVIKHTQSGTRFKILLDGDSQPKTMKMTEVTNV